VQLPAGITVASGCGTAYFGAVLMGDDSILAIPFCADHFLRIEPDAGTLTPIGPRLDPPLYPVPDGGAEYGIPFGGGVLNCDGSALVFPASADAGFRIWPDGGFEAFFAQGGARGAVLTGTCDAPTLAWGDFNYTLHVDVPLDGGAGRAFPIDGGYSPWGMVRSNDELPYAIHRRSTLGLIFNLQLVGPLPDRSGLQTSTFVMGLNSWGYAGTGVSSVGEEYVINASSGSIAFLRPGGALVQSNDAGTPTYSVIWPVTRGDGFIYSLNRDGLWSFDEAHQLPTQLQPLPLNLLYTYPFSGLVAHPSGALVGLPSEMGAVLLLDPDVPLNVPGQVLRSPYFNKL
jgi:hypothetical protein